MPKNIKRDQLDCTMRIKGHKCNILQWNIQGMDAKSANLRMSAIKRQINIIMLQEIQIKYSEKYVVMDVVGYERTADPIGKTAIYIKDGHNKCFIKLNQKQYGPKKEDTIHGSAAWVQLKMGSKLQTTGLLNIYRSPSGGAKCEGGMDYKQQVIQYMQKHHRKYKVDQWIIGGDMNASHASWRAKRGTYLSNRCGKEIYELIMADHHQNLNNEQPTRFVHDMDEQHVKYSWVDVTILQRSIKEAIEWRSIQLDQRSDHYQIHMMIDAEWDLRNDESGQNTEWTWKFPGARDKENKWNQYCKGVQNEW